MTTIHYNKNDPKTIDRIDYSADINYIENSLGYIETSFSSSQQFPVVVDPINFYLTISRFTVDASSIPIHVMDRIVNPLDATDINYTPYSVTLVYNEVALGVITQHFYQVNLIYIPQNNYSIIPSAPQSGDSPRYPSPYYFCYDYQQIIDMINTALTTSFTTAKAAYAAITATEAPFIFLNYETSLINLIAQYEYLTTSTGTLNGVSVTLPEVQIFVNCKLYDTFLQKIPNKYYGRNLTNGVDYELRIYAELGNTNGYAIPPASVATPPTHLRILQEGSTLEKWNALRTILFTTNTLPIIPENYETNSIRRSDFRKVITTFEPALDKISSSSSILSYFQNGPYRIINLDNSQTIRHIDFNIEWVDKYGNVYPIYLTYGQQSNVLMTFIRKDTFTG